MRTWWAGYRLLFASLTVAAIVTQYVARAQTSPFSPVNFFSFFTIESNIFAAVILFVTGIAMVRKRQSKGLDALRGAATLYMVTTGIVYVLLLSGSEEALQTTIPWVNTVLHYILPVVMLLDWVVAPSRRRLIYRVMCWWLAFPVGYMAYSLFRGLYVDWYPYPFVDPRPHGYGSVAVYACGIAVCALVLAVGIRALGNRDLARNHPAAH